MRDRTEARERGQSKGSLSAHPIMAIEKRVLDSEAYAALTFSARSVLDQLSKALTKGGNGHIFVTKDQWEQAGINPKTVTRALAELRNHGFIFKTRTGGLGRGCSRYAVTWLPVTKKDGLSLQGFKTCAWRDWKPAAAQTRKKRRTFIPLHSSKNVLLPPSSTPKMSSMPWDIFTHALLIPIRIRVVRAIDIELPEGRCPTKLPATLDACLSCGTCQAGFLPPELRKTA